MNGADRNVDAAHAQMHSLMLQGPAGHLEALLNAGSTTATHAALVCHPHPLYGGTMHNKVVYHAAKALNGIGFPVLRFNFRGTGRSGGRHDGRAESEDVQAALDWVAQEFGLPIVCAGFSFGAAMSLLAGCSDRRVACLVALGTPIAAEGRVYAYSFLANCTKPKLFVSGTEDEFGPKTEVERVFRGAAAPKRLVWIEQAGHFFEGKLPEMRSAVEQWVSGTLEVNRDTQ
ncbi:MAG TPA: alpha/beta fold hydrolase [Terriglobales bacterium]|nr:alpha/beta fold hydrolase [Terriglobales bacterium]